MPSGITKAIILQADQPPENQDYLRLTLFDEDGNPINLLGGIRGPQGVQGVPGAVGNTGAQGPQGSQGPTGSPGPKGDIGTQGIQGQIGVQGPKGDPGPQGFKGDTGDPGVPGLKGDVGYTGAAGPTGVPGPAGPKGDNGLQGVKGDTGLTGPPGPAGPTGPAGIQGPIGPKGDAGSQGVKGDTGAGVISGGLANQILAKKTATDFDTQWVDASTGGEASVGFYTKATRPSAASSPGALIYVTDAVNATSRVQISDGSKWVSVNTGLEADLLHLTYVLNGDNNGLFYYLGALPTGTWAAPVPLGKDITTVSGPNLAITASSMFANYNLQTLVDRAVSNWASQELPGQSFTFDLKTRSLVPYLYTLRNRSDTNTAVQRTWVIEGSNDNVNWTVLDTRNNDTTLTTAGVSGWGAFPILASIPYRYLRYRSTGTNTAGNQNVLVLGEIEFYGDLKGP